VFFLCGRICFLKLFLFKKNIKLIFFKMFLNKLDIFTFKNKRTYIKILF